MRCPCQLLDGTRADLFDPKPEYFEIRALAHSLASKFRWGGQSRGRITVAQHSVLVSREIANPLMSLYGLLHEFDEHLLPEIIAPFKRLPEMAWFRELCEAHMAAGSKWYELEYPWPRAIAADIKAADLAVLEAEARDLTADQPWRRTGVVPSAIMIKPLAPEVAEEEFLGRFVHLNSLRGAHWTAAQVHR